MQELNIKGYDECYVDKFLFILEFVEGRNSFCYPRSKQNTTQEK